ncbi:HI1506-related protein [Yersinia massiliensis]|uniref:HI1506-related protein n=1 Tax=Yersinia massiliensis TaxID=419257 RepID=UPI0028D7892B|nr:HI1506-related protein [Yersinia massiliensis]
MPNPNETNVECVDMVGVSVVNTAHNGYRRAGFVLALGDNILPPVTAQQWHALEADPRLSVTVITAATDDLPPRGVANPVLSDVVDGQPTRAELLLGAVMCAELETDPLVFYTKSGTPRMEKWRSLVSDDLSAEEIALALAGGAQA